MSRSWLRVFLSMASIVLMLGLAEAWDTQVHPDELKRWQSIYHRPGKSPTSDGATGYRRNEHAELTDLTFQHIGAHGILGMDANRTLHVIDLNASLFRPELLKKGTRLGPEARDGYPLEQRMLPAVPHFAGLPDSGYELTDWINKNSYCPPRPPGNSSNDRCYGYFDGWLGAGFNSSHFGTQAALTFDRFHRIAIAQAERARVSRIKIESDNRPGTLADHEDLIIEAEYLALYYEAIAQHFLQDRWSTGHMWERWNGPDFRQNAYRDSIFSAAEVAAATGLLHGAEAALKQPDPVSSPYTPLLDTVPAGTLPPLAMAEFRVGNISTLYRGVGDERLQDLMDGRFGKEYGIRRYTDVPIPVKAQRTMMLDCLGSRWAEVIGALGAGATAGTYGALQIPLARTPDKLAVAHSCNQMWLTNSSIALGWTGDPIVVLAAYARLKFGKVGDLILTENRTDWVALTAQITWEAFRRPNRTNLARGGLFDFGDAKPGNNYGAPSYIPPADLRQLPDRAGNGVDQQALFGFFNKAEARYFCEGLEKRLKPLRGSGDPVEQEVCRYLAERAWQGTDEAYEGNQSELRKGPDDSGESTPICALMTGSAYVDPDTYDKDVPARLHPGYVAIRPKKRVQPYRMSATGTSSQSIANWCARIPVLDFLDDPELMRLDVVAEVTDLAESVELRGLDLGDETGALSLTTLDGSEVPAGEITAWSDHEVTFRMAEDLDSRHEELLIAVTRADGTASQGRFVLRLAPEEPVIDQVVLRQNGVTVYHDEGLADLPDVFRLIGPGEVGIQIDFETPMATESEEGPAAEIKLGDLVAEGSFEGRRRWVGSVAVPEGDLFPGVVGVAPLSVQAATASGGWFDYDKARPGREPDTSRRLVIDRLPTYLSRIRVESPSGDPLYAARWDREPDLAERDNLLREALPGHYRRLRVQEASAVPARGEATIRLELSNGIEGLPRVQVGETAVEMVADGDGFQGRFDLADARGGTGSTDYLQISVGAEDLLGRNVDADPRSLTTIELDQGRARHPWWHGYDQAKGDPGGRAGGDDRWHKMGAPPDLSLVIVLDSSGSMEDGGRMTNAKAGIEQAFETIPPGVEVATVVFSGCGGISASPFTRDLASVRDRLMAAAPSGGTPLAASLDRARRLLETDAHPLSGEWRYLPFTDGEESCDGNVEAAFDAIDRSVHAYESSELPALGDPDDLAPPVAGEPPPQTVPCRPAMRTGYEVVVRDNGLHLDGIYLTEVVYKEQALPRDRCILRLQTRRYGVYYGGVQNGASGWRVSHRPSREQEDTATSAMGGDAVERFREEALVRLQRTVDMESARREIDQAVQRNL